MSNNREEYIISLIDRGVSSGLRDVSKSVEDVRSKMDGLQDKIGNGSNGVSGGFSKLTSLAMRFGAVAGVGIMAKKVVSLGADMEQTRVAFGTFMGDTEKANTLIAKLNEFANVTPFNNDEIIKSGRLLLAAGIQSENMVDTLKMIGDVSAGANVPIEELSAIFQKATNKGKLQAEELNQFAERGIPILDTLSKMYGKSKMEIMDMGSKGQITSDVMNQAFRQMTSEGGLFFNLMEKQSQTLGGKWSTMIGQLQTIGIKIGEALIPVLSKLVEFGLKIIQNKELLKDIAIVVGIVTGGFIAFKIAMGVAALVTGGFSTAFAALNAIMWANPIGVIIGAIVLLTTAVVLIIRHWNEWKETIFTFIDVILLLSGPLGMIILIFKKIYKSWDKIKEAFTGKGIIEGIKEIGRTILDAILEPLQKVAEFFGMDTIAKGIEGIRNKAGIVTNEKVKISGPSSYSDYQKTQTMGLLPKNNGILGLVDSLPKQKPVTTNKRTADGGFEIKDAGGKTKKNSNVKSGLSEIKAGAPKTFNINIGSLIKEQNFETVKDMSDISTIVKNEVSRLLFGVVNDVQTT
jgi:tape measure domain-containing protein